jgi:hypothetical protein
MRVPTRITWLKGAFSPTWHRSDFKIVAIAHHSVGAIEGIRLGVFRSDFAPQPRSYAGLQKIASDAEMALKAFAPAEIDALAGKEVMCQSGERTLSFTAENFVLSFSLPHFHFHATTAYDILRANGVPLGKRDYMGPLRLRLNYRTRQEA